ncbi:hypothetical protein GQ55_4G198200 [Panicum hallii var. hallii]|uniref:Uncharacterized protein n=1 Tax=Panicum hallii var. hallii TaxID=1504633 RepID=A0A2T7DZ28_9POAL|nr:hypothetical protein GQ55_4G198200 [Panicum hallii var. hallii]
MSTSGNPIKYGPVKENPLIGHNAPSVQNFLKGKRTLNIKTTSKKKKKQRTADGSTSESSITLPQPSPMINTLENPS